MDTRTLSPPEAPAAAPSTPGPAAPAPTPPPHTSRSAQVALVAFLVLTLGLLAYRGYGAWLGARPTDAPRPALVDLNTAGRTDLEQIPGIGPAMAREIAADREKNGPFRSVEELRRVKGMGPVTFDKVRAFLRVEPSAAPPAPPATDLEPLVLERKPAAPPATPYPRTGVKKIQPGDPPINVNAAPADELMRLPAVGPVTAQNIIAARTAKPFRTVADLDNVKGIGPKTLEKLRPFVVVE
jgi:competence protein ComEA